MRIPSKHYTILENTSKIDRRILKNYIHGYSVPSKQRAIALEKACSSCGINIPKEMWIFGTANQRKQAILELKL